MLSPEIIAQLPMFVAHYAVLLFALTVHEAAHAYMARQCGDHFAAYEGRLSLNPLVHIDPVGTVLLPWLAMLSGGVAPVLAWAKPVPVQMGSLRRPSDMMWIALAGPVSNLILAVWGLVFLKLAAAGLGWQSGGAWSTGFSLALYFVYLNVFLALFNMIPIPPLDGSRVLYYTVIRHQPWLQPAWEWVENISGILLLLMVFTGIVSVLLSPAIGFVIQQVFLIVF